MSKLDILRSLILWAKDYNRESYSLYLSLARVNPKAAALELLKCRIRIEPSYLYLLTHELIAKLGYEVQQVSIDTFPEFTGLGKPDSTVTIITPKGGVL